MQFQMDLYAFGALGTNRVIGIHFPILHSCPIDWKISKEYFIFNHTRTTSVFACHPDLEIVIRLLEGDYSKILKIFVIIS